MFMGVQKGVYKDVLHLNKLGHIRLYRSIHAALLKEMWKILDLSKQNGVIYVAK